MRCPPGPISPLSRSGFARRLKGLRAREPASLAVCTLLDKAEQRVVPVPLNYTGFTIPDEFVVGYGLDYRELHRNLPFLAVLKREVYASAEVGRWNRTSVEGGTRNAVGEAGNRDGAGATTKRDSRD